MPEYPELRRTHREESTKELVRRVLSPAEGGSQALQHRLFFYLLGALVVLLFLLALARSMNPSDSALRDPEMTVLLAPWDGSWTGEETCRSLNGVIIDTFRAKRVYQSATSTLQEVTVTRTGKDGAEVSETRTNKVLGNGRLRSVLDVDSDRQEVFEGEMLGGEVFWYRETPDATYIRRGQITGSILVTEDVVFPHSSAVKATITTGLYKRVP